MSTQNPYKAYSQASHTVPKTRQVVMLYDGMIRNLKQAMEAMRENRIEDRYHKLVRVSEILLGLQMSLDFDQGQEAAQVLYDFYSYTDTRIMQLHRTNDLSACQQIIDDIREMRDIWNRIDKGEIDAAGQVSAQGTGQLLKQDSAAAEIAGNSNENAPPAKTVSA